MPGLVAHRLAVSLWLCGVLTGGHAFAQATSPQFHNYNAPGNLESTVTLGCVGIEKALPQYNPVDLFKAVKACIDARRWDDAVRLHLVAMTFGRFDMARVADQTAHQAITVAQMEIYGSETEADRQTFSEHAKLLIDDPQAHAEWCRAIARIGPPTYFPRYMIQHGMGAFLGNNGNGLVKDFDPATTWRNLLTTGRKCPA